MPQICQIVNKIVQFNLKAPVGRFMSDVKIVIEAFSFYSDKLCETQTKPSINVINKHDVINKRPKGSYFRQNIHIRKGEKTKLKSNKESLSTKTKDFVWHAT